MTNQRRLLLGVVVTLILSACTAPASPESGPVAARPITDILVSDPQFDAQSNSATLQVTTRLPVVCAVVYGTTHAYGQIATDTDMAGGGHSDHHPILTDLQPYTVYYARLQGVGPDGTLYRSEEYTFRTLPAETGGEVNLASPQAGARVVGVSSNYGGGSDDSSYGALKAIDGNPSTQWSSDGEGDEAWIEVELAAETHVTRIGFWTRTMGSSAQIQSFQIVTERGETIGPFDLADASRAFYFDTDFIARRLRFEVATSSGGNTGAVEIEVYGEPPK